MSGHAPLDSEATTTCGAMIRTVLACDSRGADPRWAAIYDPHPAPLMIAPVSKPPVCAIRSWLRVAAALAGASLFMAAAAQAPASAPRASGKASSADPAARLVQIPGGRKLYLECRGRGGPTVILVSGVGDAADVWSSSTPA